MYQIHILCLLFNQLMQFEMTYHKEAHTIAAGFSVDVTALQVRTLF